MFTFAILLLISSLTLAQTDPAMLAVSKIFQEMDADHDGKISLPENQAYSMNHDTDKDSKISKAEYNAAFEKVDPTQAGHEGGLFAYVDRDSDGQIDKAEIAAAFTKTDVNGDGHIDPNEFQVGFQKGFTYVAP